jgi:MarR family transcriptional repressor of emrRAB
MNKIDSQIEMLDAHVQRLSARMPDLPSTEVLLCRLLMHVGRTVSAIFEQQIRPSGLAEAEFRALTALFSQPEGVAHPSDLCAGASQTPANMSRIGDALAGRDLITRELSVQDRRRMVLHITEKGKELVRQLLPPTFVALREMLSDFSEAEQRALISGLKCLGTKLDQAQAQGISRPLRDPARLTHIRRLWRN